MAAQAHPAQVYDSFCLHATSPQVGESIQWSRENRNETVANVVRTLRHEVEGKEAVLTIEERTAAAGLLALCCVHTQVMRVLVGLALQYKTASGGDVLFGHYGPLCVPSPTEMSQHKWVWSNVSLLAARLGQTKKRHFSLHRCRRTAVAWTVF